MTWRMPAEWERHQGCLMAWPTRRDLWNHHLDEARREYAATAAAIVAFEPVVMIAAPDDAAGARSMLPADVEVTAIAIDDSWIRDSGPIFTVGRAAGAAAGERSGADFAFNSWGEKFEPWDQDAMVGQRVLEHLGVQRRPSSMVLEGGSITVDGAGTAITTVQCNRHPNRNPAMSREEVESELASMLGLDTVIWLPWGLIEDLDTDGHVDNVCTFVRPGVVLAHGPGDDSSHPNHARMSANLNVLRTSLDTAGAPLEVIEVPQASYFNIDGDRYRNSYLNFYVANGGVVVPVADHPNDAAALAIIGAAFPEREVVGVPSRVLAYGGGGVHCITQQIPS
ncbi:MAG: agmatine deiminase [Candidatus Azotimanducaceae bacterium]|jgi:agmatine deiminase